MGEYVEMLRAADVAKKLKMSQATLAKWRSMGTGPKHIKLGGLVRYESRAVDAWIEQCRGGSDE